LIELLVAVAILAVVAGMAARPTAEVTRHLFRVREESTAMSRNMVVLDLLGRDVRLSQKIRSAGNGEVVLVAGGGEEIRWTLGENEARRITLERATQFPMQVRELVITCDRMPPLARLVLVRGDFTGLGKVERMYSRRIESLERE
jgi:type II secretory pathway pseudopilin PulG